MTDIAAGRQLKVISEVLTGCESIIVGDRCRTWRGNSIFRWIYSYLGCTKPFKRLWISSLTDEAIREGMASSRKELDMTACMQPRTAGRRRIAGGHECQPRIGGSLRFGEQLHRTGTDTDPCMICARFKENRNFVSTPYWQLHIVLKRDNGTGSSSTRRSSRTRIWRRVN